MTGHFDPPPPHTHPLGLSLQKVLYATQMQMSAIGWLQKNCSTNVAPRQLCFMFQLKWVVRKFWSDLMFQSLMCIFHSYFTFVCMNDLWMINEWRNRLELLGTIQTKDWIVEYFPPALFLFCFVDRKPKTKQWSVFPPKCKLQLKDSRVANACCTPC